MKKRGLEPLFFCIRKTYFFYRILVARINSQTCEDYDYFWSSYFACFYLAQKQSDPKYRETRFALKAQQESFLGKRRW